MQIKFAEQVKNRADGSERKQKAMGEQVRRLTSAYIRQLSSTGHIGARVTVTRVVMAKNLKHAEVYIADEDESAPTPLLPEGGRDTGTFHYVVGKIGKKTTKSGGVVKQVSPRETSKIILLLTKEMGPIRHFMSQNLNTKMCPSISFVMETTNSWTKAAGEHS